MSTSNRIPLALGALALVVAAAGLLAPLRATTPASAAAAAGAAAAAAATGDAHDLSDTILELVLFGSSLDDLRLDAAVEPLLVYRVPDGLELRLTDVDATAGGLVLWRRSQQQLEQVGFIVDRGSVGLGQSARSYATGILFVPGDELLVQAAGGDVEWAVLRGVVRAAEAPRAGS
jgi:hypothetical protein